MYIEKGTVFNISYKNDGLLIVQKCILAKTYDEEFLFQIIPISGYYAGEIDGFIAYQFPEIDNEKRNICTLSHLKKQLKMRVYSNLIDFEIVD